MPMTTDVRSTGMCAAEDPKIDMTWRRRDFVKSGLAAVAGATTAISGATPRPAFALAPAKTVGLLAFRSRAGQIGTDILWRQEQGEWDWQRSIPLAADVGDRKNQPCFLYSPANGNPT